LAEYLAVPDISIADDGLVSRRSQARIMTWNKLCELLPTFGYTVEKKRKRLNGSANPLNCYMITGNWHDVEIVASNNFYELVAAKSGDFEKEED